MKFIILAGGKGTRLELDIQKCMVEIKDKPLIQYHIESAIKYGFKEIYIMAGYKSEEITNFLGENHYFKDKIYIREYFDDSILMGTAGCLSNINTDEYNYNINGLDRTKKILDEGFILVNGDNYCPDFNYQSLINYYNKNCTEDLGCLVGIKKDHPMDSDIILIDGMDKIKKWFNKPHTVQLEGHPFSCAGIYIFKPEILKWCMKGYSITENVIPRVYKQLKVYKTDESIIDIGTPERLRSVL